MSDRESLQYPVGHLAWAGTLSLPDRAAAIETLAGLPQQLSNAVEGLTDEQLDTPYRPQGWSIRQVIHHVADSHMNAYSRIRHALTMDWPEIFAYDQAAWAKLPDSSLPIDVSLPILRGVHQRWVHVLRNLPEDAWTARGYVHPENGRQSLEQVLASYAWHSRHHLAHVLNCRARYGW